MWPNQNRPRLSTENLQTKPCHGKNELIMFFEFDLNFQNQLEYLKNLFLLIKSIFKVFCQVKSNY